MIPTAFIDTLNSTYQNVNVSIQYRFYDPSDNRESGWLDKSTTQIEGAICTGIRILVKCETIHSTKVEAFRIIRMSRWNSRKLCEIYGDVWRYRTTKTDLLGAAAMQENAVCALVNSYGVPKPKRHNNNTADIYQSAQRIGLHYQGDCNIEHGGTFYNADNWTTYGYADAIEVSISENQLFVTIGCINRKDELCDDNAIVGTYGEDIREQLEDDDTRMHVEIDHCKSQWGVECHGQSESFNIVDNDNGEFVQCKDDRKSLVSIDHLQGWIMAHYCRLITS